MKRPHIRIENGRGLPSAGLLCEWRKTHLGGGRVVVLSGIYHDTGASISIIWVQADRLTPDRVVNARV